MSKTISIAIVLFAAACSKSNNAPPMVPSASLDEQNQTTSSDTSPTASSDLNDPDMTGIDLEDEEGLPGPSEEIYAGGSRGSVTKGGATGGSETHAVDPDAATLEPIEQAVAVLIPTKGNKIAGTIRFVDVSDGIEVVANLKGLPKGKHAFHVHMFGDCSAPDGSSAGEHFKFTSMDATESKSTGSTTKSTTGGTGGTTTMGAHVAGDLGDLDAKADGSVTYVTRIPEASLQGSRTLLGRSVVVHQNSNEMTSAGAADKRLACGVIGIAGLAAASTSTTTTPESDTKTDKRTP